MSAGESRSRRPRVVRGARAGHEALGLLLARAQEAGAVRAEIRVTDLVVLLKGLLQTVAADQDPALRQRVFAVRRDGLRPPAG